MQDRPTAIELLQAAQEFIEKDLQPALTGRVRFHARVLQNVLGILEREWAGEHDAANAEWERLRILLDKDEPKAGDGLRALGEQIRAWNTELSTAIRAGEMDDRFDEAVEAMRETVAEKLQIANPRYGGSA
jgi:hypothetical protein